MTNTQQNTSPPIDNSHELLTSKEVMAHLKISKSTFYRMAQKNRLPPGKQLTPSLVRFCRGDIDSWVELHPEWFTRQRKG